MLDVAIALDARDLDLRQASAALKGPLGNDTVEIRNAAHLHGLCAGLKEGEYVIAGDAGDYVGVLNDGATIREGWVVDVATDEAQNRWIATPNALYPDPAHFADQDHAHVFSPDELRDTIQRSGLIVDSCFTIFPFLSRIRPFRAFGVIMYRVFQHAPYFATHGRTILIAAQTCLAFDPNEWRNAQTLEVPAKGLVRVSVPTATLDAAQPGLEDLRIVDPTGNQVPYLIEREGQRGVVGR